MKGYKQICHMTPQLNGLHGLKLLGISTVGS